MSDDRRFPLDLERTPYSYAERHNAVLVDLVDAHVLRARPDARILDVGCGCGANARAVVRRAPGARVTGIEPNDRAAGLAEGACAEVFRGDVDAWLASAPAGAFDGVVLADVLEHVADPIRFLRSLGAFPGVQGATWVLSVPNYAVWYNRAFTLAGRFRYAWSGLYDRTHLRFYTRRSLRELLAYCGLEAVADRCTPSIVQSAAPVLRKLFDRDVRAGNHLALEASPALRAYERFVEPIETAVCGVWPELLGFQIVTVARRAG